MSKDRKEILMQTILSSSEKIGKLERELKKIQLRGKEDILTKQEKGAKLRSLDAKFRSAERELRGLLSREKVDGVDGVELELCASGGTAMKVIVHKPNHFEWPSSGLSDFAELVKEYDLLKAVHEQFQQELGRSPYSSSGRERSEIEADAKLAFEKLSPSRQKLIEYLQYIEICGQRVTRPTGPGFGLSYKPI